MVEVTPSVILVPDLYQVKTGSGSPLASQLNTTGLSNGVIVLLAGLVIEAGTGVKHKKNKKQ